jgi:hypothetical protein
VLGATASVGGGSFARKLDHMAQTIEQKYASDGHPSIEELKLTQGTIPTVDARELRGDFWPEEENIDDFLAALRGWRGNTQTDQAA